MASPNVQNFSEKEIARGSFQPFRGPAFLSPSHANVEDLWEEYQNRIPRTPEVAGNRA